LTDLATIQRDKTRVMRTMIALIRVAGEIFSEAVPSSGPALLCRCA
jgi:hypothetical protein